MASKTKATPRKEEMLEKEGPETPPDSPLLDRSNASVKALVRAAKKRGDVTDDQISYLTATAERSSSGRSDWVSGPSFSSISSFWGITLTLLAMNLHNRP